MSTERVLGRVVIWEGDRVALVVADRGESVNLRVWDGDGCGVTLHNVPRAEVESRLYRPAPVVPPSEPPPADDGEPPAAE